MAAKTISWSSIPFLMRNFFSLSLVFFFFLVTVI